MSNRVTIELTKFEISQLIRITDVGFQRISTHMVKFLGGSMEANAAVRGYDKLKSVINTKGESENGKR